MYLCVSYIYVNMYFRFNDENSSTKCSPWFGVPSSPLIVWSMSPIWNIEPIYMYSYGNALALTIIKREENLVDKSLLLTGVITIDLKGNKKKIENPCNSLCESIFSWIIRWQGGKWKFVPYYNMLDLDTPLFFSATPPWLNLDLHTWKQERIKGIWYINDRIIQTSDWGD